MTKADKVIEDFVLKHAYDPVYAREYYLRTRKLKERDAALNPTKTTSRTASKVVPKATSKTPKRVEEDQVPTTSPTGAKLVDYDGSGSGKATYSDGSVFDGNGWTEKSKKKGWTDAARAKALETRLKNAREKAEKIGGEKGKALLNNIDSLTNKLSNSGFAGKIPGVTTNSERKETIRKRGPAGTQVRRAERVDAAYNAKERYTKAKNNAERIGQQIDKINAKQDKTPLRDIREQYKLAKAQNKAVEAYYKALRQRDKAEEEYSKAFNVAPEKEKRASANGLNYFDKKRR